MIASSSTFCPPYRGGGCWVSPPRGPPLGNFIEGQAHPVIETDIFSDVFCKIFVHSICVFFIIFFSLCRLFSYVLMFLCIASLPSQLFVIIFCHTFHCFNSFSVAFWQVMHHVREKPLPYNQPVVTYSVLTVCDRSVVLFNITDLITNSGGTVSL